MNIPLKFNQGDTFTWTDRTSQYQGSTIADGAWQLTVSFRGPVAIDLVAPRMFGAFTFTVDQTQAAKFTAGRYRWVAKLKHLDQPGVPSPFDGVSQTLEEGTVDVLPDITQFSSGFDARTQTEKDLEAVDHAIRQMISGGAVQEYQIGNRSVKKMSMEALQTLRSRLQYQLARERKAKNLAAGFGDPSNVLVRFTR